MPEPNKKDWWPMLEKSKPIEIEWSSGDGKVRAREKGKTDWKTSDETTEEAGNAEFIGRRLLDN